MVSVKFLKAKCQWKLNAKEKRMYTWYLKNIPAVRLKKNFQYFFDKIYKKLWKVIKVLTKGLFIYQPPPPIP